MYRVYDSEKKHWITDDVCLTSSGKLFKIRKFVFGWFKFLSELSTDRYICHRYIQLEDKNGIPIYEGDYLEAHIDEDKTVIGLVAFAPELSGYVILCADNNEFYTLGTGICEYIQKIGDIFGDL